MIPLELFQLGVIVWLIWLWLCAKGREAKALSRAGAWLARAQALEVENASLAGAVTELEAQAGVVSPLGRAKRTQTGPT